MTPEREDIVVGVVGHSEPRRAILAAIAKAGASATNALVDAHALVLDAGDAPERLVAAAASLASDPRTALLPRVLVVDGGIAAARLASFGAATIVPEDLLDEVLVPAISTMVEHVRERNEALRAARGDLRMLEHTLAAVQRDGVTLSHDARVLFGIILGFASNVRDGFGGPVTEDQRRQLDNIVEASTDATTLLDRYVTALRRLVPPSAEAVGPAAAPATVRRHVDLGELVRGTVSLLQGVAAGKRIRLRADTSLATHAWCDAMQIKQALVNLLGNALKFTPAGGSVEVAVRPGPPASSRNGLAESRDVEIVVRDTGPGIPEHERERVFERGVRLERDLAIPGTGLGLAIVRDIATFHGGLVRIDETPGGGATIALVFPVDLRGRTEEHARANASPAPPRVRSASIPPSSPRQAQLRRDRE